MWESSWLGILGKSRSYLSVAKEYKPISDSLPRKMHCYPRLFAIGEYIPLDRLITAR